jgi:hypothetical protein
MLGIFKIGLTNYLPRLALNHDPPDLCILSRQDYRLESPVPGLEIALITVKTSQQ